MGYTSYIRASWRLAVALGIGFAIANPSGVACAENGLGGKRHPVR